MRIALLAPLAERVPPELYGGTELVVSLLCEGLTQRGHDVTLFASGDSVTKAKLVSVSDRALRLTDEPRTRWSAYELSLCMELEKRKAAFDVVHNHMGWVSLPFLKTLDLPSVSTNHNIVKDYCKSIYGACKDHPYVAISESYRSQNYPDLLNYVATVYNGIDIDRFKFDENAKRDYLLFVGRLCGDKGAAEAIKIARRIGMPLKVAGKVDAADKDYFDSEVLPLLSEPGVDFIGEVDFDEKVNLYANAYAVVYPIAFEEPFGLVMAEALASGAPVLALRRGAVSEVLTDGETAVIAGTSDELVLRFAEVANVSRAACHKRAQDHFSASRMLDDYERVYQSVSATHTNGSEKTRGGKLAAVN